MSTGSGEGLADKEQASSGFESLLAQLRRKSDQDTSSSSAQHPHDLLSQFAGASMQQQQQQQLSPVEPSYYGHQQSQAPQPADSPANGPPSYANNLPPHFAPSLNSLPSAPTPPVGGSFPTAQFPPSLLGSIGSGRPTADRGAPSSHLLSLLKFSGHGSSANSVGSQAGSNNGSNNGSSSLSQPPLVPLPSSSNTAVASASNSINGGPAHHHLDVDSEPEPQLQLSSAPITSSIIHAPAPAPSDPTGLLAALIQGTLKDEPPKPEPAAEQATLWQSTSQSNETQQYLLNLLNRPKPSQNGESFDGSESGVQQEQQQQQQHQQHQYQSQHQSQHQYQNEHQYEHDHHQHYSQPHHQHQHRQQEYTHYNETGDSSTGSPATLTTLQTADVFDYQIKDTSTDRDVPNLVATLFSHNNPFDGLVASPPVGLPHTPKSPTGPGSVHSPTHSATSVPKSVQILRNPASQAGRSSKPSSADPSPAVSPTLTKGRNDPPTSHQSIKPIVVEVSPREEEEYEGEGEGSGQVAVAPATSDEGLDSDFKNDYADTEPARESAAQSSDDSKEDPELNQEAIVQQEINMDLEDMANAKTDEEFHAAAQAAGRALKLELERDDNRAALEQNLSPDVAKSVRKIVDEAAQGGVADSWESADADGDETPIAEDQVASVKVFNFPMKPWISIEVQDDDKESRPVFRDESVLGIARLKKDFDQIDRNLVASSENYMVYGMSKAGGLRVIRQLDGRDAKLFTDTKDRIFNVAMSHNNDTETATPKESVIGTGISGTVYWVQIRDGDKDHLEYAHPELYGFALPPIMSHEGDTPGGVLKTRARTSTGHPEYFAVGRGKSINIVWPGFVMKNNLFQPGHDRVVDTEKLSKQCSLKINTGKAGKDFTFSQDDSVVVSLDKSGRVKFWDVLDLTAAHKDSDPANPMPAHTNMEVKEPLLTLTTTPEGEKAWPTSVLLLDKLRPYQKHCALRYMIVGMKQNHTLQLWDLALAKPVQEFNLPHSKESDAVCSVMYHPPTGMIVVGHPTRNSVYFLHLSAPKYAMKSMSQVEYIQRLTAGDSSIPQPESTAVISGLREYSLANHGALRSLDILQNPAANADGEDPTLFELYAMHSKGVGCIAVRQGELGWTKDNKVMDPVDAVLSGKVKIGKLKTPPQQPVVVPAEVRLPEDNAPRVIATRPATKEIFQDAPNFQDTPTRKPVGISITSKLRAAEPKDEDAVVSNTLTSSGPSTDKTEKKSRKKKAATGGNSATAPVVVSAAAATVAATATIASDRAVPTHNGSAKNSTSTTDASKNAGQPGLGSGAAKSNGGDAKATLNVSQEVIQTRINTMEARICERVSSSVHVAFDDMRKYIDQQFRSRDTDFEQKQRRLLDMVSEVLNGNTEQVLGKIVHNEFETAVLPTLRDDVARSVVDSLGSRLSSQVPSILQKELQRSLPSQVTASLRSQEVSRAISDKIVHAVASHVDSQLSKVVATELIPAISSISTQTAHTVTQEVYSKVSSRIGQLEEYHAAQDEKISALLSLVTNLSETVANMASAQSQYQAQITKLQNQVAASAASAASAAQQHQQRPQPLQAQQAQPQQPRSQPQSPVGLQYLQRPQLQQRPSQLQQQSPQQPQQQQPPQQQQHHHSQHHHHHQQQQQQQQQGQGQGQIRGGYEAAGPSYESPTNRTMQQIPGAGPSPSQHSNSSHPQQPQKPQQPQQQQPQQPQPQQTQHIPHQLQQAQVQPHPQPLQQNPVLDQQQHQAELFMARSQEEQARSEFDQAAISIDALLRSQQYDDAMMRWLQSNGKEEELFRQVLVNYSPDIVSSLQPLVLLSVGTTVTQDLDGPFLVPKLNWVEMVLLNFYQIAHHLDDQTREITPSVLLHIRSRLEQTHSRIAKVSMSDSNLKSISQMMNIINRIVEVTKPQLAF